MATLFITVNLANRPVNNLAIPTARIAVFFLSKSHTCPSLQTRMLPTYIIKVKVPGPLTADFHLGYHYKYCGCPCTYSARVQCSSAPAKLQQTSQQIVGYESSLLLWAAWVLLVQPQEDPILRPVIAGKRSLYNFSFFPFLWTRSLSLLRRLELLGRWAARSSLPNYEHVEAGFISPTVTLLVEHSFEFSAANVTFRNHRSFQTFLLWDTLTHPCRPHLLPSCMQVP